VKWLANRWTLGAAAWVGFSFVVWYAGDAITLGELRPLDLPWQRAALIIAAAAAWLGWEAWRARQAQLETARMLEAIAVAGAEGDSAARASAELETLRSRFVAASATLKQARFTGQDGETRRLHELPWYMFIGAPGSGKTTALVNSGLRFPLDGNQGAPSVQGVGGTRNCDWWFTEDAVLLDTAGRYTTQESDRKADAAAWYGFLGLLKQYRPHRPLNGALVTVSVSDLMLWSKEERMRYAGHVRMRLAELYARLGSRFPVYVLVTKADLLAGFMEFFGEQDAAGRARVWGTTFAHGAEPVAEGLAQRYMEEFGALQQRLDANLVERLHEERDLQRRAAIYRFPQQFHALGPLVGEFIGLAFAQQQNHESVMLRGVYYTSGTQEGNPIDRVLGALSRSFGLDRAAAESTGGAGKSFFLSRLLREVIFPEQGLARDDVSVRSWRPAAYAALAVLGAAIAAAWLLSFQGNRDLVAATALVSAKAKEQLAALPAMPAGAPRLLDALNMLRDLPGGAADLERGEKAPLMLRLGLSQGEKLGAQAQRAYRNVLREGLLARAAASLEDAVRGARSRQGLEMALAAYLALHDEKARNMKALEPALYGLWQVPEARRGELSSHLRAGLAEKPLDIPRPFDEALVREARQRLAAAKFT
jgi:type VI secretion system protein ImpL